jgi:predicted transposase YbfD/YdcC
VTAERWGVRVAEGSTGGPGNNTFAQEGGAAGRPMSETPYSVPGPTGTKTSGTITKEGTMRQANRQPATKIGVIRRLQDARLDRLTDRRSARGRRYPHEVLVLGLALGCVAAVRSLRDVEALTAGLHGPIRRQTRINGRISDTKLRDELLQLDPKEARQALHRQVKAEHRRGNLKPTRLPFGVVAIDGKCLGKLDSWGHPDVQKVWPNDGTPYGLARVHRAHLISADATVCVDQRPIEGNTNENGAVCSFTEELFSTYKRASLFEVITADAGNSSLAHAELIHGQNLGYVLAIKEPHGEIYQEAVRLLGGKGADEAGHGEVRREKGQRVSCRLWRVTIPGTLRWTHARQLVRVERTVQKKNGTLSVGNRYFVTNVPTGRLKEKGWLVLVRMHWRCENEGHWTADVVFKEDARRTPWIRVPQAVYALAMLRMLGLNVLAVLRCMTRREWSQERVPWAAVAQAVRFTLCAPALVRRERHAFN